MWREQERKKAMGQAARLGEPAIMTITPDKASSSTRTQTFMRRERERVRERVCVCVRERERERERKKREREREGERERREQPLLLTSMAGASDRGGRRRAV
jgi:hypothetical protein